MEEQERERECLAKQEILSWGAGTEGQLGTGTPQDEHQPQLLHSLSSFRPISFLSCGGAHVIALTQGGEVLTWGRGTSGQLGHGEMSNSLQPKLLEFFQTLVITHVSAGWNHSGFVSETGGLFTCGDGSFGQLGHGDFSSQCVPTQVLYFSSCQVLQIACGIRHSLALLQGEQVFGFGSGKRGQLGISSHKVKSVCLPHKTLGLDDVKITSIIANGDHSAALCSSSHLYIWGRGFNGAPDLHTPSCIETSFSISQAAIGWSHALVLTCEGEVFMLGDYLGGALNKAQGTTVMSKHPKNSEPVKEEIIQKIDELDSIGVQQIAAGAEHSAIVTENGSVMTWGWGEHGQLGLGNAADQTAPHTVPIGQSLVDKQISCVVYCGSGFTYTIKTHSGNS